jgi:hypothetical protein
MAPHYYCMKCMVVFFLAVRAVRCKGEGGWYSWVRMEPNWWRRLGSDGERWDCWIGRDDCWIGRLLEEANESQGAIWGGAEKTERGFRCASEFGREQTIFGLQYNKAQFKFQMHKIFGMINHWNKCLKWNLCICPTHSARHLPLQNDYLLKF